MTLILFLAIQIIPGWVLVEGSTVKHGLTIETGKAEIVEVAGVRIFARGWVISKLFKENKSLPVTMPCGQKRVFYYATFPRTDLKCPCGDKTHWIVKWD
jgi:hypothetical protein